MTVAELLVRCLEQEGVRYVFGVPGEETEDLLFALSESSIEFIPTRHEQGAAFIANVWGRITGEAGVCLATLGPGATNLITGMADANLDKAPLVALTGQGGTDRLHHESHQYLDVVNMMRPVTKWNAAISSARTVAEIVRKAFKLAEFEKPGATHVEVSEDMAAQEVGEDAVPLDPRPVRRPGPDAAALDRTVEILLEAHRPLVIAGNGGVRTLASKYLTALVQRHDIPVASTFMGKGSVSDRLPQSLYVLGLGFKDYVAAAVDAADVIVTAGYDIAEFPPEAWNPEKDKRIVHADFVPAEVYAHYQPEVEVVGDLSATLLELDRRLADEDPSFEEGWYAPVRERIESDLESYAPDATSDPGAMQPDDRGRAGGGPGAGAASDSGRPFTAPGAIHVVRQVMDDSGLLISDVGSHKMWIARNFPTYCAGGCIISNGLASMGIALPGAIAAALAQPGRQVVAAMGDGGFLMNSQELETARRLDVGFTAIVLNDDDYGLISWKQAMSRGRSVSTRISNPDFVKYAESFGVAGYRPESYGELREVLPHTLRTR
ncbi:MAG: thiamine pyrophosphate-dependent enzyme, partial [Gemmatimonadota bacterium]